MVGASVWAEKAGPGRGGRGPGRRAGPGRGGRGLRGGEKGALRTKLVSRLGAGGGWRDTTGGRSLGESWRCKSLRRVSVSCLIRKPRWKEQAPVPGVRPGPAVGLTLSLHVPSENKIIVPTVMSKMSRPRAARVWQS